jgi:hypothetical protein
MRKNKRSAKPRRQAKGRLRQLQHKRCARFACRFNVPPHRSGAMRRIKEGHTAGSIRGQHGWSMSTCTWVVVVCYPASSASRVCVGGCTGSPECMRAWGTHLVVAVSGGSPPNARRRFHGLCVACLPACNLSVLLLVASARATHGPRQAGPRALVASARSALCCAAHAAAPIFPIPPSHAIAHAGA